MSQAYTRRQSYTYHKPTTAASTHSLERETQRLGHLNKDQQRLVAERAVWAADKYRDDHYGVKVLSHPDGDVFAIVSGRSVRTILACTSPPACNKYATHPDAVQRRS